MTNSTIITHIAGGYKHFLLCSYNSPLFRRHFLPRGVKHQTKVIKQGIVIIDNTNIASITYSDNLPCFSAHQHLL